MRFYFVEFGLSNHFLYNVIHHAELFIAQAPILFF
jgi:hypothetical protein